MAHYSIRTWNLHQHYKRRKPIWIKLYRDLLTDSTWVGQSNATRVLAIACMLIASETGNRIPANPEFIKRRAYLLEEPDFSPLLSCEFLVLADDQKTLANSSSESETERETDQKGTPEKINGGSRGAARPNGRAPRSMHSMKDLMADLAAKHRSKLQ